MEITIETPIQNKKNDLLERSNFSSNIAKRINNYTGKEMLTIGLNGEWGSGKTSIINMMEKDIDKDKYLIITFNPWHFSTRKQLISDFFEHVSVSLNLNDNSKEIKKLGKDIKLYSQLLKTASYIPPLSFLNFIADILKGAGTFIKDSSEQNSTNLTEVKNKINSTLSNFPKKILVIIDELDRLENSDLKEIFQLVRALGDFENMVYLLSYDEEKVKKIFDTGEDYLEKIITLPIKVPTISKKKLNSLFLKEIDEIFNENNNLNSDYWIKIYQAIFEDSFNNVREIKRFLNLIKVNSEIILNNINVIDYLAVSFLQCFKNDLYKFIIKNKEKLLNFLEREKLLEKLKGDKKFKYKKIIETMFNESKQNKFERRLCTYKYFDCYFEYYFERALSREELTVFLNIDDSQEKIGFLKNKNDLILWFEHLDEIYSRLEEKEKYLIFECFLPLIKYLKKQEQNSFKESEQKKAFGILKDFTSILNDRSEVIKIILNNELSEEYELKPLIDYCNFIYERSNVLQKNKLTLSLKDFIFNLDPTDCLFSLFKDIKKLGINLEVYIKKIIITDEGLLNYLKKLVQIVDAYQFATEHDKYGNVIDYDVEETKGIVLENMTDYISHDFLKSRVNQLNEDLVKENEDLIRMFENAEESEEIYKNFSQ